VSAGSPLPPLWGQGAQASQQRAPSAERCPIAVMASGQLPSKAGAAAGDRPEVSARAGARVPRGQRL
jgi:hypothetical protein